MPPAAYADWLEAQDSPGSLAEQGRQLFLALGCSGCHVNSARVRAPDLAGIWGRPVAIEGGVKIADAAYMRDSILQPEKEWRRATPR